MAASEAQWLEVRLWGWAASVSILGVLPSSCVTLDKAVLPLLLVLNRFSESSLWKNNRDIVESCCKTGVLIIDYLSERCAVRINKLITFKMLKPVPGF